jgi:hypothetical protein
MRWQPDQAHPSANPSRDLRRDAARVLADRAPPLCSSFPACLRENGGTSPQPSGRPERTLAPDRPRRRRRARASAGARRAPEEPATTGVRSRTG